MWLKRKINRAANYLLSWILRRESRRTIFLATLFVEVGQIYRPDPETLKDISEKLRVPEDSNLLKFPTVFHDLIWMDRNLKIREFREQYDEKDVQGLAQRIIRTLPEWTNYSDHQKVLDDAMVVIRKALEYR